MEPNLALMIPAGIAFLGVIYILYIAASVTREEMSIHDLRVSTMKLRNEYAKRLAEKRGDIPEEELVGVDIEGEEPAEGAAPHERAAA
jgi:hypothetical protein